MGEKSLEFAGHLDVGLRRQRRRYEGAIACRLVLIGPGAVVKFRQVFPLITRGFHKNRVSAHNKGYLK